MTHHSPHPAPALHSDTGAAAGKHPNSRVRGRGGPGGLNASRQLGAGLGASLFIGIVTVAQQRLGGVTLSGMKDYRAFLSGAFRDCFELGTALCLTAAAIALPALPRRGDRTAAGDPGLTGGAPAGTAGSPGSSGR
ncbi:hypothetical protein [Streptomyces sp. NPDC001307]|uniref:hypothetical protein n=1 Tax=Streptomyces sp. NPDC001307 TaxID=3364560 RepID=UPI0036AE7EF9